MSYASGETPRVQDRISNKEGRIGTLLDITENLGEISELIVRWDDGVVRLRYRDAEDFKLISRAPQQELEKSQGHSELRLASKILQ